MKRTANDFIVGLVVVTCVVAVIAATMWVNQTDLRERREPIVARFRDVGNVRVGSAVVIRGVQSGRVEGIELAEGGWVRMRLRLDEGIALPRDPVVLLNAASLFGEWQATITSREAIPQNPEVRRQIAEAGGDHAALPGAMLPDIAQLTTVAGGIAGNVASVAERFKTAFDDRAAIELRASIGNVATLSSELARTVRRQSQNLDSLSRDVHGGVGELRASAEAFRRVAERIDSSTSDGQVRSIVRDLARAAQQLEATTGQVRTLSDRLATSQLFLDRLLARSDSVMAKVNAGQGSLGMFVNDPSLYQRSDSLVAQMQGLIADFKANPRRYVNVRLF
jgi:phospholipid/cholesterol/gamma-HCH transport system substrate-binding protein